jgi:site-specific DNA-methyltransferase (adenine-specific)
MKRGHEPSAESTYSESGSTNFAMKLGARRLDEGSAARFFYCAKADRTDRNEGCEEFSAKPLNSSSGTQAPGTFQAEGTDRTSRNHHPTVKPTDLMRWLLRLVTPPGGTTLDCFMGSGSTLKAALLEGFDFIGIEKEADFCAIAKARAEHVIATDMPLLRQGAI